MSVIHSGCFPKSDFRKANQKFYCPICFPSIEIRYNPFKKLIDENNQDSDRFFDQSPCLFTEEFSEAPNVLEKCKNIDSQKLEGLLKDKQNILNTLFYNIEQIKL